LYSFPKTATTGEIRELGLFEGVHSEKTFEEIQIGLNNFGFAVVTMHPQEFSMIEDGINTNLVNYKQISELGLLIEKIQDAKLQITFLEEINKNIQSYKILMPKWFEKTLQWHDEKKISDTEFSDAMNYLKRQGIVKFGLENMDF
jgi:Lhr-like helicase